MLFSFSTSHDEVMLFRRTHVPQPAASHLGLARGATLVLVLLVLLGLMSQPSRAQDDHIFVAELGVDVNGFALHLKVSEALTGILLWEGDVTEIASGPDIWFATDGTGGGTTGVIELPTDGFFVLTFSQQINNCGTIKPCMGPDPAIRYAWSAGEGAGPDGSFFQPEGIWAYIPGAYLDTIFTLDLVEPEDFVLDVTSNSWLDIELTSLLGETGWTLPYDIKTLCGLHPPACGLSLPQGWQFISAGVETEPGVTGPNGTGERLVPHFTFRGSVEPLASWPAQTWDVTGLELRFRDGHSLNVLETLNASGVLLTAENPALGWDGVRFLPGSEGAWSQVTVERVTGPYPAGFTSTPTRAVSVTDATPTFTDVTVRNPANGTGPVDGFYVTRTSDAEGPEHAVVITRPNVQLMTGRGIVGHGGARVEVVQGSISGSGEVAVFSAGTSSSLDPNVYLVPALSGTFLQGPIITGNPGGGVAAASGGAVRFGAPSPADGFTRVNGNNPGRGMKATGGGAIYAGTGGYYRRNAIFDNGGSSPTGNGYATGTMSRIYARCDWWGSTDPYPFRTGAASGGLVDVSDALAQNPIGNPAVTCPGGGGSTGSRSGAPSGASASRSSETALDRLAEAVDAPTASEAVALLAGIVADEPDTEEAAAALAEVGLVASRPDGPASATRLLTDMTVSEHGPLRAAAWQALVGVRRAQGDRAGALDAAGALAAEGGAAVVQAELARVSLHAEAGDSTAAFVALAALEALAPESVEVGIARAVLGLSGGEGPAGGREMAAPTVAEVQGTAGTIEADAAAEIMTLLVQPNPAGALAAVVLALTEPSDVAIVVYDVLGRAVATPLSGALAAGDYRVDLDVSSLAPGVYVVRAEVNTSIGHIVRAVRLTVTR